MSFDAEVTSTSARTLRSPARGGPANPGALPALVAALKQDASDRVRIAASAALDQAAAPRAIPALTAALRTDANQIVRQNAASALRFAKPDNAEAVTALQDENVYLRIAAAGSLAYLTPDAVAPRTVLIEVLKDDSDKNYSPRNEAARGSRLIRWSSRSPLGRTEAPYYTSGAGKGRHRQASEKLAGCALNLSAATSCRGGAPYIRRYSRLNWDWLSYPT
jgi:HEAT repeats